MDLHGGNIYRTEKKFNIKKEDVLDFSSNINPLGISRKLREEIISNLGILQNYPDPDYFDLRSALSEYNNIGIDNILVGNGATELIFLFARTLKPKTALILSPSFLEYSLALNQAGTKLSFFRLKEEEDFFPDIERLKKEMDRNYELLVICNPNNPTSVYLEPEKVEEIIIYARKKRTKVMLDESFIEFIDPGLAPSNISLFNKYKNLFILRSLTKFFAIPGLRLGYVVNFDNNLLKIMRKNKEPWSVNQFAELAGRVLLRDKDYIEDSIRLIEKERKYLYNALCKIEWLKPYKSHANFFLVRILGDISSSILKTGLEKQGILIRDASNFKFLNDRFIRIAVRNRKSNKRLYALLSTMKIKNKD